MELPAIIKCPRCKDRPDSVNMGSISSEGYLIVKGKYNRYTMVMASEYSIICDCGYFIRIHEGKIVADATSILGVPS